MSLKEKIKNNKKGLAIRAMVWTVLSMLYFRAQYWQPDSLNRKIGLVCILLLGIVLLTIAFTFNNFFRRIESEISQFFKEYLDVILEEKKKTIVVMSILLTLSIAYYVIFKVLLEQRLGHLGEIYSLYLNALTWCVGAGIWLRKVIGLKPELLFFLISMIIGLLFICTMPPYLNASWDEESHYANTLNLVTKPSGYSNISDLIMLDNQPEKTINRIGFTKDNWQSYQKNVEINSTINSFYRSTKKLSIVTVCYAPEAFGVSVARGLHLPYFICYKFGKFFNLLLQSILFALGIRKLKYGKTLLACIGLIPTVVYLGASYSYDPWLNSFTVLGLAYAISIFQNRKERKADSFDLIISGGSIFVGCIAKLVYFPTLLPLLFMPASCFKSKKQSIKYRLYIISLAVLSVLLFMIPFIAAHGGGGDMRGGSEVNPGAQVSFILHEPIQYALILLNFLNGYLDPINSKGFLSMYGYLGTSSRYIPLLIALIVVALLDRKNEFEHKSTQRIAMLIAFAGMASLVPTALYISFTAVKSLTIQGCQPRYILPWVFPMLYYVLPDGFGTDKRDRNWFPAIGIYFFAGSIMLDYYTLFVANY